MSSRRFGIPSIRAAAMFVALTPIASSGDVEVIFSEISGDSSAVVPGAVDSTGLPTFAEWTALYDFAVSHDGSQWMARGLNNLGSAVDQTMALGSGATGSMFMQEGQPFKGGIAGEVYSFFDTTTPVSWDTSGNMGFSCRAKGGSTSIDEKVVHYNATTGTHTVVYMEGDLLIGCQDIATNPSGDEIIGSSVASVNLLDSGEIFMAMTPIGNCSSFRYPGVFKNNVMFRQSGYSTIGTETWDSFGYADCGMTPDGLHWFAEGDTENPDTKIDKILVVDDVIVLQENQPVAGSTMLFTDVFHTRMLSSGDWFARGDDPNNDDWAVRNNVMIARTGDPITSGATELWGNAFTSFTGNRVGGWALTGNTNEIDTDKDSVLVVNDTVRLRESDPVDLDGNGLFDDDLFIRSFGPNDIRMTDNGEIYLMVTLKNGAGTSLGDAFLRLGDCGSVLSYGSGCPGTGGQVPALTMTGCPKAGDSVTLGVSNGLPSSYTLIFFGLGQISIPMDATCVALVNPLPAILAIPLDGTGQVSLTGVVPVSLSGFGFTSQAFVVDGGVPHLYSNSNGIDVSIK